MTINQFSGSIPDSITQMALSLNFSVVEKARRENMLLNKNFYYGKQEEQLTLVNEDVIPTILNLTQPIVKKRSTLLYRKPIKRTIEGPDASINYLELVYSDNNIDSLMLAADLSAELTGTSLFLLHPDVMMNGGIRISLYDSSQFSVIPNQDRNQEADAISLVRVVNRFAARSTPNNPQVETVLEQQIWTDSYISTFNTHNQGHSLELNVANDLGFIPYVALRGEPVHDEFLGHAPTTDLRKLNQSINQALTDLTYAIKMQGATPIAIAGFESGEGVTVHPGRAFSLPAGASATVLDMNPKIEAMLKVIEFLEVKAFETNSVPKVAVVGGEGASGRELMIRFFPLLQVFQDKAIQFKKGELDLANMVLKVAGLDPIVSISLDYPEESILPLSSEDESLLSDISLGLKTPMDELMRRNPDIDEVEAEAQIRANKEFNAQIGQPII
jgi:hypothetical protein